jgi:NusA-like KH domain protein
MTKTFDMQLIRYMNLFGKVTRISAKHCFIYNNTIVYVVAHMAVQMAIGRDNSNLKRLSEITGKRIRVIAEPRGVEDLNSFISVLVAPIKFEKIEIVEKTTEAENKEKEVVIMTGDREAKAMLIGRGRARETELKEIIEQYFKIKNVRIN